MSSWPARRWDPDCRRRPYKPARLWIGRAPERTAPGCNWWQRNAQADARTLEERERFGKEAEFQQDHAAVEGKHILRGAYGIAIGPGVQDSLAKVIALGRDAAKLAPDHRKEPQKSSRVPPRQPQKSQRLHYRDFFQMRVEPAHQGKEIVWAEGALRFLMRSPGGGKLVVGMVRQKRADTQAGKALLRQERVSADTVKISGDCVKVDQLGKAMAGGMELKLRRTLEKREVLFIEQAFVGGQHQHAAVRGVAELLQHTQSG
ncbi:MAG: hypothetical protein ACXVK3_11365 [Candidatus Angelobacter sp.]